jgi:hypothetical protein
MPSDPDDLERWTVEAHLFSGRPDPKWVVGRNEVAKFLDLWRQLAPAAHIAEPASPPSLGYRGCTLHGPPNARWLAAGGLVTHTSDARAADTREDRDGAFESALLASVPAGPWQECLLKFKDRTARKIEPGA